MNNNSNRNELEKKTEYLEVNVQKRFRSETFIAFSALERQLVGADGQVSQ